MYEHVFIIKANQSDWVNMCSWSEQTDVNVYVQRVPCTLATQLRFTVMRFNKLTSNAKSWPLQIQIPDIELSLSFPNKHIDANAFFRILSNLWYMPGSDTKQHLTSLLTIHALCNNSDMYIFVPI
jgi:hypothetical protein